LLLEGVRVVEFASLIAGPFCALTLSDLGADVVKVEPPGGDDSRAFPPFDADRRSGFFDAFNRGKRGAVLDLSTDDGRAGARALVERADVVVENLGQAERRLGFGHEDLAAARPRLVWCSVTGLGADNPGRTMDPSLQATMGLMATTGQRDGPPGRVPVPLIDYMTGMYAAQSILAALWQAERTGRGAFLDCALLDSAATLTTTLALLSLGGHLEPGRIGSESYLAVPSAVFEASDGVHVQVVALHDRHWRALCSALGHEEWADVALFAGADARASNRDLVHERVGEVIAMAPARDWVERINAAGGMCQRVRAVGEAWADPLLAKRDLVGRLEPWDFPFPLVSLARSADPRALRPAPALGEHTAEILEELDGRPA
jgi:crotonobetainyl-CoA:carnitine CoA-transferase CaiB-like acyl-CoA transferase